MKTYKTINIIVTVVLFACFIGTLCFIHNPAIAYPFLALEIFLYVLLKIVIRELKRDAK